MAAKQSAAVDRALRDVARGMSGYAAARKRKISLSAMYRALKRQRQREHNAVLRDSTIYCTRCEFVVATKIEGEKTVCSECGLVL